jgi:hypothetical protein
MKYLLLMFLAGPWSYWIQPCGPPAARESGCQAADADLAEWALQAWAGASGGSLAFRRIADENKAHIRIYWAPGNQAQYGEARPIIVDGQRGAEIHVRPDLSSLGPEIAAAGRSDPLFRHAIVYLTCLHESGHAIGLSHTAAYEDIMYFFGYGGDLVEYFARYRRKLARREDIRLHSGISPADRARLQLLHTDPTR